MKIDKIYQGDSLEILKTFPDESIDCVITSPPYWALRDYKIKGQLGLEQTFQRYINRLCDIFDEIKRILKKEGTCWVNIGDTYVSKGKNRHDGYTDPKYKNGRIGRTSEPNALPQTICEKNLVQIPNRFAIEMQNRGWILRNEIIWYKPNAMPSSVKDRFTVDFEKVFFFVKNKKYWFETQYEKYELPINRWGGIYTDGNYKNSKFRNEKKINYPAKGRSLRPNKFGRNKRCVWKINTKGFSGAHFAVFPEKLVEPLIKAGCPEKSIVLDPFFGAGTTGVVAKKLNRNYIGIELNPEYIQIAKKRIFKS